MKYLFSKITLFMFVAAIGAKAQTTYSQIWGRNGEKWDHARLPDFTHAGYKGGGAVIPVYPVSVNVKDFGAKGDGIKDNTAAFKAAINRCGYKGSVYIPAGLYLLSDSLIIAKSGVCIKGAGQGKTVLFFSKGLEELYPDYNKAFAKQTKWSWSGAMISFQGKIRESGIEDLSIQFPDDSLYGGHNWHERGFNGIGFANGAHDGWINNLSLIGCDVGIWIEGSAHHITVDNWILDFGPKRAMQKLSGHHGVNIYGGYNLLQNFEFKGRFVHDLSVESTTSTYNVFRNGKGTDLCIDHHNHAQTFNLFTHLDAGLGSRLYFSGGVSTPRGICFKETFWNITSKNNMRYCDEWDTAENQSAGNTCVGIKTVLPSNLTNEKNNWFESVNPAQLYPQDIYQAQMDRKKHH